MTKRPNPTILISLCTSCAILAFARYEASIAVSGFAFYIAAALICLWPVLCGSFRHKTCQTRRET
jgi:hypothetical protein